MTGLGPLSGVRFVDVPTVRDDRGALSVIEAGAHIPFAVARVFYMHHMTVDRGGHAHHAEHSSPGWVEHSACEPR